MIIETARLVLTPVGPDAVDDLLTLHADPWVARWNAGAWSVEQAEAYATEMAERWRDGASDQQGVGKWMAHRRVTGELVGRGGLTRRPIDGGLALELGRAVRDRFLRRGFATEIGAAGLTFAYEQLGADEVVAYTEVHNVASRGVMERLGMTFDKIIFAYGLVESDGIETLSDEAPFALYRRRR